MQIRKFQNRGFQVRKFLRKKTPEKDELLSFAGLFVKLKCKVYTLKSLTKYFLYSTLEKHTQTHTQIQKKNRKKTGKFAYDIVSTLNFIL